MLGKIYGRRKRLRLSEDEMVGWHHRCKGLELGQSSRYGEGQGMLLSMGSQRAGHDWVTAQQQKYISLKFIFLHHQNQGIY